MIGLLDLHAPPILLAAWGGGFSWTAAVIAGIAVAAVVVVVATPLVLAGGMTVLAGGLMAAALGVAAGTAAGYWFADSNGPGRSGPTPRPEPEGRHLLKKIEISFPPSPESPDQARPFFCRITETRGDGASPISEEITAASTPELRKEFERKLAEIIPSSSTPRPHVEARIYTQPFPGQPIIDEFSRLLEAKGLKPDLVASPPPP